MDVRNILDGNSRRSIFVPFTSFSKNIWRSYFSFTWIALWLKQAPHVWFDKFHLTFKKDYFRQISYVPFTFLCRSLTRLTIQVYANNIMVSVETKKSLLPLSTINDPFMFLSIAVWGLAKGFVVSFSFLWFPLLLFSICLLCWLSCNKIVSPFKKKSCQYLRSATISWSWSSYLR